MTYFFRQQQMAKGWGKEIRDAWSEEDHPRGKTTPESNSGSFAPKGGAGGAGGGEPPRGDNPGKPYGAVSNPVDRNEAPLRVGDRVRVFHDGEVYVNGKKEAYFDDVIRDFYMNPDTKGNLEPAAVLTERTNAKLSRMEKLGPKTTEEYAAERVGRARRLGEPVPGEDYPMPKDPRWSTPEEAAAYRAAAASRKESPPVGEGYKELQRSRAYQPPEKVQVGAILRESWGYEQTNINYYQVTGMSKSGKTVTLREIAGIDVTQAHGGGGGPMDGKKRALPDAFEGKPFTRRVSPDGKSASGKYGHFAGLWDGKDDYYSWYH